MKIVEFDNGYYGIKLWFSFLDRDDPVHRKWYLKENVRTWSMIPTLAEAQQTAKRYQDYHKPLNYKILAEL